MPSSRPNTKSASSAERCASRELQASRYLKVSQQVSKAYSGMDSAMPRRLAGRTSLLFAVLWCLYFLLAGWAVSRVLPVFATLLAGMGFAIPRESIRFYLIFHSVWFIAASVAILIVVVLIRQFVDLSDVRRRLIYRFLIVITIVSVPFVVAALAFAAYAILFGPFQLIGKLPE